MSATPRRALSALLPVLAAGTIAACGSSSSSPTSTTSTTPATPATPASSTSAVALIKTGQASSLGATVLTNAQGMTLYSLSGETNGKFICSTSACTAIWHPVMAPATGSPSGSVGSLGVVRRPDGSEQVTYKGLPLYTFADDEKPGEAKGQGIKDVGTWTAVRISSSAGPSSGGGQSASGGGAGSPSESGSSGSSGGYGY